MSELEKLADRLDQGWMTRNGESWNRHRAGVSRSKSHARSAGGHRDSHRRRAVRARGSWSRRSTAQTRRCRSISAPPNRVTRQRAWRPVACSSIEWTRRASPWSKPRWIATRVWCRKPAGFSRSTTKRPIRNSRLESANGARRDTQPAHASPGKGRGGRFILGVFLVNRVGFVAGDPCSGVAGGRTCCPAGVGHAG